MNRRMVVGIVFVGVGLTVCAARLRADDVMPLVDVAPTIDGAIGDEGWSQALIIDDFTRPLSGKAPEQPLRVRVYSDGSVLYAAFICAETDTNRIVVTRSEDDNGIWLDDCVELWVRDPRDNAAHWQFIVNPMGTRQTAREPATADAAAVVDWTAAARIVPEGWACEMAIPLRALGLSRALVAGEVLQVKFGREDYTTDKEGVTYATWPPGTAYGGRGEFGRLRAGRATYLLNPELQRDGEGGLPGWSGQTERIRASAEAHDAELVFETLDDYAAVSQAVKLPPESLFVARGEFRGTVSGYLRVRTEHEAGGVVTMPIRPSETWHPVEVLFRTGEEGRGTLILGSSVDDRGGELHFRNLAIDDVLNREVMGQGIALPTGDDRPLVVQVLPVADARVLRGFCGAPVDGSLLSWDWAMRYWEYNMPGSGTGVKYRYRGNDGLHIRLAATGAVDAVQVRGGVHARVVRDATRYDDPASGVTVHEFVGRTLNSLARFDPPLVTDRISFFDVRDGVMADVGFFRLGERVPPATATNRYVATADREIAEALQGHVAKRFAGGDRTVYGLASIAEPVTGRAVVSGRRAQHLVLGPLEAEQAVTAIGLSGRWSVAGGGWVTIEVQDPVHPFAAIARVTVEVDADTDGSAALVIDIPDHVLRAEDSLWLTVRPHDREIEIEDLVVDVYTTTRAAAVAEAVPFQMLRLKGLFAVMSEARPWNELYRHSDLQGAWRERYKESWPALEAIMNGTAYCLALDSENALAEQYRAWFFRRADAREGKRVLREARVETIAAAPDWAVLARQAWLLNRGVADWWLSNRLVPTGEFGSEVNDDSCLYQNFANHPMLERDGVAGRLLDAAGRFWTLTIEGGYLEAGINASLEDPLHAYEEGINHESMMACWHYGDPLYMEQCMTAAAGVEGLTMVNAAGHRHFMHGTLSSADLRNDRPPEIDGHNHAQLLHPVLEVARYNRNPRAVALLGDYMSAWLDHMRTPGAYATQVEAASDRVVATGGEPFMEGMGCQMSVAMTAADVLRDPRFVEPAVAFLAAGGRAEYLAGYLHDLYTGGYLTDPAVVKAVAAQSPWVAWADGGTVQPVLDALRAEIAELQTFAAMYTTAEPFTDRVFLSHDRHLTASTIAYTGGYATRNKPYRSHAVSWDGFGTDYAALVRTVGSDRFQVWLYNFADAPLTGWARFWKLAHGRYEWVQGVDRDGDERAEADVFTNVVTVITGNPMAVTLPPKVVTVLDLRQLEALPDLGANADLAVVAREFRIEGDRLTGVVHNIGSAAASPVVVALVNNRGDMLRRVDLGTLEAPLDLAPRRLTFELANLPEDREGLRVVVDPGDVVQEITKLNNRVMLADVAAP